MSKKQLPAIMYDEKYLTELLEKYPEKYLANKLGVHRNTIHNHVPPLYKGLKWRERTVMGVVIRGMGGLGPMPNTVYDFQDCLEQMDENGRVIRLKEFRIKEILYSLQNKGYLTKLEINVEGGVYLVCNGLVMDEVLRRKREALT